MTTRHKFDVKHANFLDSPERRRFLHPYKILKNIGIKPGMKIVDVGCGIGFFAIPLARLVGDKGKVFAIAIQEEMVSALRDKKEKLRIKNIEAVVSTGETIPLPSESVDIALMAEVLHELNDYATVKEVHRILKPYGILAVLEWKKKRTKIGPPQEDRLTQGQTKEVLEKMGLSSKHFYDMATALFSDFHKAHLTKVLESIFDFSNGFLEGIRVY